MAPEPVIVSLWASTGRENFRCSGLLLTGQHILTAKHAFENWPEHQPVYVRLIDGVEGDMEAKVLQCHQERDAAILQLTSAVKSPALPNLQTCGDSALDGRDVALWVIDPDSFGRSNPTNYSIANFDHRTGEYVLFPANAKGHSGGMVEVGGKLVGILSRRKPNDPLCRAVALHLLGNWINACIGDALDKGQAPVAVRRVATTSAGYAKLVTNVRSNLKELLQHPDLLALSENWRHEPLDGFDHVQPTPQIGELMKTLLQATERCIPGWRGISSDKQARIKEDCRIVLSELVKLAVNPDSPDADLAAVAAGSADHLYLACQFGGTAEAVYCALKGITHSLEPHDGPLDVKSSVAVHTHDYLPSGEDGDLRQEILKKLWVKLMDGDAPSRIDGKHYQALIRTIRMSREWRGQQFILAATGPREWGEASNHKKAATDFHLGLVLHEEGECPHLLLEEENLVAAVRMYLKLLKDF